MNEIITYYVEEMFVLGKIVSRMSAPITITDLKDTITGSATKHHKYDQNSIREKKCFESMILANKLQTEIPM